MKSRNHRSLSALIAESETLIAAARQALEASRRLLDDGAPERARLIAAIEARLSAHELADLEQRALERLRQQLPGWERYLTDPQRPARPAPGAAIAGPASLPPGQAARSPRRPGRARQSV